MLRGIDTADGEGGRTVETVPTQLAFRGFGPRGSAITAHQRRAREVIDVLSVQLQGTRDSDLANFLLHYHGCEVLAKLLQGARIKTPPETALTQEVHLNSLRAALRKFGLAFDNTALDRIFLSIGNVNVEKRSAKRLRNKIVRELNNHDIEEIHRRGAHLIEDMASFIETVESAANEDGRF